MRFVMIPIAVLLITIALETLAFVGIGELFNLIYKKSKFKTPPSLGHRLFTVFGESAKLARKLKSSSETLEPDFIAAMNRTPLSVMIALLIILLWCITGIVAYIMKPDTALAVVTIMAAELVIIVIAGRKLSAAKKKGDDSAAPKCMKCKVSKLSTYHTIRLRQKTFATIRMPNGSRYKMIPVTNFVRWDQKEKIIDVDIYCVAYYDYLPFAKCVIDPKALPKLKS